VSDDDQEDDISDDEAETEIENVKSIEKPEDDSFKLKFD
jgi:hypothetical protein